jgi:ABC-2 type transport system ATP-binding protein
VISAHAITRRYGARTAVDNVSFDVQGGEVFGLLGPNGAGKTSVLRMLGGLIPPTQGTITIDGRSFTRQDAAAIRGRIGFLTEMPGLWDNLTVLDNLSVYARLFGMPRPELAAELVLRPFELWDRRHDRAGLLSKGMRQKLALARALVHEPEIVLLDEPTANLDPQTSRLVRDLLLDLRAQGRAVVISTHNLTEVERFADRVALLSRTLIAIGEPATLRREVFGRRLRVRMAAGYPPLAQLAAVAARAGAHDVRVEGHALSMVLESPEAGTPAIVRRLVDAGAEIREVFEEQQALEDVYMKLLNPKPRPVDPRRGARP